MFTVGEHSHKNTVELKEFRLDRYTVRHTLYIPAGNNDSQEAGNDAR